MITNLNLTSYNNTSYPLSIKENLSKLEFSDEISKKLKYHQFLVKEFFTRSPSNRGLLIKHDMGMGKTRLAVAIADHFIQFDKDRKIIILLPKSLEGNFRNTIRSYAAQPNEDKYKFISLNASNMFKHVADVDKTKEEIEYEKKLGDFVNVMEESTLNNTLLIVDEAHRLFNSITNGSKNGLQLYDLILKSRNIKLIFLTGTPIINDPFELVPCFNMLRGFLSISGGVDDPDEEVEIIETEIGTKLKFDKTKNIETQLEHHETRKPQESRDQNKKEPREQRKQNAKTQDKIPKFKKNVVKSLLFSESVEEFENYFMDIEKKKVKNKDKFTNRIFGLCSYYGELYFSKKETIPGFPTTLETKIEYVNMSIEQFTRYITARNSEQDESKFVAKGTAARFVSNQSSSTYRVKSRQISNYCIPEYALGPSRGAKAREKFIDKITIEDLKNTSKFSPKMGRILTNLNNDEYKNKLGIVYSQFVSGEGIGIFARVLEANNFERYQSNAFDINDKKRKFAMLTGDIDPDERSNIISIFNNANNADGSIISILLLSGAVSEGIDLKRVRHVHIMEPFWNYARIKQVETRAVRYLSHEDLPEAERNVKTFIYLSDYPVEEKQKQKELTTDVELYNKSIDKMKIIDDFTIALAESSIDCSIHFKNLDEDVKKTIHCKMCSPDNKPLFHPILQKDMLLPNACQVYSEKKLKVMEIIFEPTGEKFYYTRDADGFKLYLFNKKINGYTAMGRSHPNYGAIMEKLLLADEDLIRSSSYMSDEFSPDYFNIMPADSPASKSASESTSLSISESAGESASESTNSFEPSESTGEFEI